MKSVKFFFDWNNLSLIDQLMINFKNDKRKNLNNKLISINYLISKPSLGKCSYVCNNTKCREIIEFEI